MAKLRGNSLIILAAVFIIVIGLAGAFWFVQAREPKNRIDPNTSSLLSEGFKTIEEQDSSFANVTEVRLVIDTALENDFTVIRAHELVSADSQASSSQALATGTISTLEAYGAAKQSEETGESAYNSSYFVYKLDGGLVSSTTSEVIKAQLQAAINSIDQGDTNPNNQNTFENGPIEQLGEITLETTGAETIKLPASKFEQTIRSKTNPDATPQKIVRVLAAAKLGSRLVAVSLTVADTNEFGKELANLQAMAKFVRVELIR